MDFRELEIPGVFEILLNKFEDERGSFARTFCQSEFKQATGLNVELVQINHSFTKQKGSIRGMHYQMPPYAEDKLVRVIQGRIIDVVLDIRIGSSTFMNHLSIELSSEKNNMIFIPKGCAHGFQALTDDVHMLYHHTALYHKDAERGLRYNDPTLAIEWPQARNVISQKDAEYPLISNKFSGVKL